MPQSFSFFQRPVMIWTPLAFRPNDNMNTRNNHYVWIVGRLKPGVSDRQADSDLNVIAASVAQQFPSNAGLGVRIQTISDRLVGDVKPALLVLFGAVLLVLLVACVNLANLLLSRAAARQREFGIRSALGATRRRLVRQFLHESALLAAFGVVGGVLLGSGIVRALVLMLPASFPQAHEIRLDPAVLAFTALLGASSVLLFGLLPSFEASGVDAQTALHASTRSSTENRRSRRMRNTLVVVEMALARRCLPAQACSSRASRIWKTRTSVSSRARY